MEKKSVTNLFNGGVVINGNVFEKKQTNLKRNRNLSNFKNLSTVNDEIKLPINNSFNCAIINDFRFGGFIIAFRISNHIDKTNYKEIDDLHSKYIGVCRLDSDLNYIKGSMFVLSEEWIIDPRLLWVNNKLLITCCKIDTGLDYIVGSFILDYDKSEIFNNSDFFRVSPNSSDRQKNWVPFYQNNKLYFIASINPHVVYEYCLLTYKVIDVFKHVYNFKWINNEKFLRGNTPPILLDNGEYLNTFHTTENILINGITTRYYDNGFYTFESKPPFKPKKLSNISYLYAEMASRKFYSYDSKPFNSQDKNMSCQCTFPLGMVNLGDDILISYGDRDSLIKYIKIPKKAILNTLKLI